MNEFFKLMKMELAVFKSWNVRLFMLWPLWAITMFCNNAQSPAFAIGMLAIIFFAAFLSPNGMIQGISSQDTRFFLNNIFRAILPAKPWKIGLAVIVVNSLILLLMYVIGLLIVSLLAKKLLFNPAVYPFVLFLYMQTVFSCLTFNQEIPKVQLGLEIAFWSLPAFCFLVFLLALAADPWSWLVMLAGAVLTAVNCIFAWNHVSVRRAIPGKIQLAQAAILILVFVTVLVLNWKGSFEKTMESCENINTKTEVQNVR